MEELQIISRNGIAYGIRDQTGYLFFFREISKFSGQDERYKREIEQINELADYLLDSLKKFKGESKE